MHRRRRIVVGALGVIAVLAVAVAGYGIWTFQRVDRVDLDLAAVAEGEPRNYLVIGSDSRAEVNSDDPNAGAMLGDDAPGGRRSDSIAVLRVDPDDERIDVLSIPRDLWVTLPDGSQQRINAAYAESTQTLIDTIDENLGIPIHHFAEVDFAGFQRLIDALGGVPMYFETPVRDVNSGLRVREAGCTVLDGPSGLAFARSRHLQYHDGNGWQTDPSGDLGRMTRQQLLMRAALGRARSLGLGDIGRLKGLVDAGLSATTVDSGLGFGDILGLGQRFSDFDPQRLQTHSLAVEQFRTSGGAAVLELDEETSGLTLLFFRGESPPTDVTTTTVPPPRPSDVTVSLYNGGGVEGEARRVSYVLSAGGFGIDAVETSEDPIVQTTVSHAPGAEAMAALVADWLGPAPQIVEDDALGPGEVTIELGRDFRTVAEPSDDGTGDTGGSSGDGTQVDTNGGSSTAGTDATSGTESTSGTGSGGSSPTTTTTLPGWTPGVPPEGVECS